MRAFAAAFVLAVLLFPSRGSAHPHVWIDTVVQFVFAEGKLVAVREFWIFDEFFSEDVIKEFDKDGSGRFDGGEMAEVYEGAFIALKESNYFTHVRVDGGDPVAFGDPEKFNAAFKDGRLAYGFTLPLPNPVDPVKGAVQIGIHDPEYYLDIRFKEAAPVMMGAGAPGCDFVLDEDQDNPIYLGMVVPEVIVLRCGGG